MNGSEEWEKTITPEEAAQMSQERFDKTYMRPNEIGDDPIKQVYDEFVAKAKEVMPDEEFNTWEELSPIQRQRFEAIYTRQIALHDAMGAAARFQAMSEGQEEE